MYIPFDLATVVPDDDCQRGHDEDRPSRSQTPPTPPVHAGPSQSPPPSARPMRQRAMAQLRPVLFPRLYVTWQDSTLLVMMKGLAWELN